MYSVTTPASAIRLAVGTGSGAWWPRSNGIPAMQLWKQLGLGSYKSAWLLAAKLRRAMVDPERNPLSGLVEIDETTINHRTRNDPLAGGPGRSHKGKLLIAGTAKIVGQGPGRIRLAHVRDYSAGSLPDPPRPWAPSPGPPAGAPTPGRRGSGVGQGRAKPVLVAGRDHGVDAVVNQAPGLAGHCRQHGASPRSDGDRPSAAYLYGSGVLRISGGLGH